VAPLFSWCWLAACFVLFAPVVGAVPAFALVVEGWDANSCADHGSVDPDHKTVLGNSIRVGRLFINIPVVDRPQHEQMNKTWRLGFLLNHGVWDQESTEMIILLGPEGSLLQSQAAARLSEKYFWIVRFVLCEEDRKAAFPIWEMCFRRGNDHVSGRRCSAIGNDLTGLFWTRPYERVGLAKELGDAEEAV
jgi:hypothetical protein